MVVPDGVVGQRPRELKAVLPVKVGRLERVRVQSELAAAAATRDLLGGVQQAAAESRPRVSARTHNASIQHVPPQLQP
jgi:hypothetical protein